MIYLISITLLILFAVLSLKVGVIDLTWGEIKEAILHYDGTNKKHLVVHDSRILRVVAGTFVGASLAVSGTLTQGITRNDMADSGIIGLSAGASAGVAICLAIGKVSYSGRIASAILGAFFTLLLVMFITSLVKQGSISLRIIMSGAMVTMFLSALSQAIAIYTNKTQNMMFWTLGDISGVSKELVYACLPVMIVGIIIAILVSKYVTIVSISDEIATSLGVSVTKTKLIVMIIAAMLSACSFLLAGNITFVGILTGNLIRNAIGQDYKYVIPLSGLFGAILVLLADVLARSIHPPTEFPIGSILALIGVPVFLYFISKRRGSAE